MSASMLLSLAIGSSCGRDAVQLDPMYAQDHLNYLCMNYTRATPLPCAPAVQGWTPRWYRGDPARGAPAGAAVPRFTIFAWWPPNEPDFAAYADAGFNLGLTQNYLGSYCRKKVAAHGPNVSVSHDELFDANVDASTAFAKLGVLAIFDTGNDCNNQTGRAATVAYGNRTGGVIEGHVNITARAEPNPSTYWTGQRAQSKGQTIPELEYITSELTRRNVAAQFGGILLHDDTLTQTGADISSVAWLKAHAPWFVPLVNQVGGVSGPQTLYAEIAVSIVSRRG